MDIFNKENAEKVNSKIRIEVIFDARPKTSAKSTVYKKFGIIPMGKIFYIKHPINNYPSYFIKVSDKSAIKISNCVSNVELHFIEDNVVCYTDYSVSCKMGYVPKNEEERKFLEQNEVDFESLNNLDLFYYDGVEHGGLYVRVAESEDKKDYVYKLAIRVDDMVDDNFVESYFPLHAKTILIGNLGDFLG